MSSYTQQEGHGPAPGMPPSVVRAAKLPPVILPTHVFFFGHEGSWPETVFQQWHQTSFTDTSVTPVAHFRTAEHYMMYRKAVLFHDNVTAARILAAATPAEAKTLGREVQNFSQSRWDAHCDEIVEQGNYLKFSQNPEAKSVLMGTGNRKLIEASPSDRVWGIGFAADEIVTHEVREAEGAQSLWVDESHWGENKLGRALERVRARLR